MIHPINPMRSTTLRIGKIQGSTGWTSKITSVHFPTEIVQYEMVKNTSSDRSHKYDKVSQQLDKHGPVKISMVGPSILEE